MRHDKDLGLARAFTEGEELCFAAFQILKSAERLAGFGSAELFRCFEAGPGERLLFLDQCHGFTPPIWHRIFQALASIGMTESRD